MNTVRLIKLIDIALIEVNNVIDKSIYFKINEEPISGTIKALILLKKALQNNPKEIDIRILRAMRDLGMRSFKNFENTPLEDAICDVTGVLYEEIPHYENLKPLGIDFGKEDPI